MRWFLSGRAPDASRVLLIESGPRELAERVLPKLRDAFGADTAIDLLTCLPTDPAQLSPDQGTGEGADKAVSEGTGESAPESIPESIRVWRVSKYADDASRWGLLREIRGRRHGVAVILCAGDGIMGPWRTAALVLLPAKFLLVNENADYFWIDLAHGDHLIRFWLQRAGLLDESAANTIVQYLALPLTFTYLCLYAAGVHLIRLCRMALGLGGR